MGLVHRKNAHNGDPEKGDPALEEERQEEEERTRECAKTLRRRVESTDNWNYSVSLVLLR